MIRMPMLLERFRMRKGLMVGLCTAIFVSAVACAAGSTSNYFEKMRVDDAGMVTGIAAIKNLDASPESYYKFAYDADGLLTHVSYITKGKAATDAVLGVSQIAIKNDEHARYLSFFDEAGFPTPIDDTVFILKIESDVHDRPIACSYFDKKYVPTRNKNRVSQVKWQYGGDGQQATIRYFDEKGQRIADADGVRALNVVYDAQGFMIQATSVDDFGKPQENKDGHAVFQYLRDSNGALTEIREFQEKNIAAPAGYAFSEWLYDQGGNVASIVYSIKKNIPKDFYSPAFGYVNCAKAYNGRRLISQSRAIGKS